MKATGSQGINSVPDRIKPRLRQIISEEQLERKRAHDRLAQRANRQRTKQYIKYLERQVAELKDKLKGYGDAIQHNAKLQHGNLNLQLQLAMIVDNNGYLNNTYDSSLWPSLPLQCEETMALSSVSAAPCWQPYISTGICPSFQAFNAGYLSNEAGLYLPQSHVQATQLPLEV